MTSCLNISKMTLLPNKAIFAGTDYWDSDISAGGKYLVPFFFFAGFPMGGKDIVKHFRDMRERTISLNNYLDGHLQNVCLRYDIPCS